MFCVICIYEGIPLNQTDQYALTNICGLSEVGLPSATDLISEFSGADTALNHEQDRQISDPVSAIMGNGCLLKQLFWKWGKIKHWDFLHLCLLLQLLRPANGTLISQTECGHPPMQDTCKWNKCKHTWLSMRAHMHAHTPTLVQEHAPQCASLRKQKVFQWPNHKRTEPSHEYC